MAESDKNNETTEQKPQEESNQKPEREKKKYSFKCLEKECDNRVCCTRPIINVTIEDISRWTTQNVLPHILHAITLHIPENEQDHIRLEMAKRPLNKNPETSACILYNEENNACTIRYSRPISCRTFPLSYTGTKFVLSDKTCPGIGKGEVTKEALKEARDLAEQEFRERISTLAALPGVYSVFTTHMLTQSMKAMEGLSEEDRRRIQEIMSKGQKSGDSSETPEKE